MKRLFFTLMLVVLAATAAVAQDPVQAKEQNYKKVMQKYLKKVDDRQPVYVNPDAMNVIVNGKITIVSVRQLERLVKEGNKVELVIPE